MEDTSPNHMHNKKSSKLDIFIIAQLFVVYLFTLNTQVYIPYNTTLRWISLFLLFFYSIYKTKLKFAVGQLKYIYLPFVIIAVLPSIVIFATYSYTLQRFISLILLIVAFGLFLSNAKQANIIQYFNCVCFIILVRMYINAPFIFLGSGFIGGRFSGMFSNANSCAFMSAWATICSIYLLSRTKYKILPVVSLILNCIMCLLSNSRMGLLILFLGLILIPFINSKNKKRIIDFKILFSGIIIIIVLWIIAYKYDFAALQRFQSNGYERETWDNAFDLIKQRTIFGWGYAMSSYYADTIDPYEWTFFSSYLDIAVNIGVFGLSILMLYFANGLIKIVSSIKHQHNSLNLIQRTIFVLVMTGLLGGVSESYLLSVGNPLSIVFWFALITGLKIAFMTKKNGVDY